MPGGGPIPLSAFQLLNPARSPPVFFFPPPANLGLWGMLRFRPLFSGVLLLPLAVLAPAALIAQSMVTVPADYAYRPLKNEGYMQAWNFNFRGGGTYVYITYVISNFGPGDLNNGVSIMVYQNGQSIVRTAEYTDQSLKATSGAFGLTTGDSWLRLNQGKFEAYAHKDDVAIRADMTPVGVGVRLSGGPVDTGGGSFIRADVPVGLGRVKGSVRIGDKEIKVEGEGGLEYLYASSSPHAYAKSFALFRSYDPARGLFLGGFHGTSKFPGGKLFRLALTTPEGVVAQGKIGTIEQVRVEKNQFSGYEIPLQTRYTLEGDPACRIDVTRTAFAGGYHVLGHVSALLRWVVKVLFAKPYIMHYTGTATVECPGKGSSPLKAFEGKKYPLHTSYYMIND